MPEAVVDRLEVVKVDEQDCHLAALASPQSMPDTVVKELSVGEPRKRIMEGLVFQTLLELLLPGDVHQDAVPGHPTLLVPQCHCVIPHPHRGPGTVKQPVGVGVDRVIASRHEEALLFGQGALPVLWMKLSEPYSGVGHPLLGREAEDGLDLRADVEPSAVGPRLGDIDDRRHPLDLKLGALLQGAWVALDQLTLGDLTGDANRIARVPIRLRHQRHRQSNPQDSAVLADETLLQSKTIDLPCDHLGEAVQKGLNIIGMGERRKRHHSELIRGIAQSMPQDIVRPRRSTLEVDDADTNRRKLKDWVEPTGSGGPPGGSGHVLTIEVGALADVTEHPPSIPKDIYPAP